MKNGLRRRRVRVRRTGQSSRVRRVVCGSGEGFGGESEGVQWSSE